MGFSFKSMGNNDVSQTDTPLSGVPVKKRGWLIIFALYAALAITAIVLGSLYRVLPKRSEVLAKRKAKPEFSSYALILSPLKSDEAHKVAQSIMNDIGEDSTKTKMVISGTAFHKQCTSLAEYGHLITQSAIQAQPPQSTVQAQLTDKMLNIMISDKILAQFYIIGNFGNASLNEIQKTVLPVFTGIDLRSKTIGKVHVFTYFSGGDSLSNVSVTNYLKDAGFVVTTR